MELMWIFTKLPADCFIFYDLGCVLLLSSLFTAFDVKQCPHWPDSSILVGSHLDLHSNSPDCLLHFSTTLALALVGVNSNHCIVITECKLPDNGSRIGVCNWLVLSCQAAYIITAVKSTRRLLSVSKTIDRLGQVASVRLGEFILVPAAFYETFPHCFLISLCYFMSLWLSNATFMGVTAIA